MFKRGLWTRRTTTEITMLKRNKMIGNLDLLKEIQRNNIKKNKVEQKLKKGDGLAWKQDGITYLDEQIYISNNRKIKEQILQENHDHVNVSHPGQQRMMELVKMNYWWPGFKEDIKKYVQRCFKC